MFPPCCDISFTDIVNYLVAGDQIATVKGKYGLLNSKGEEEVNEEDEEVEDSDSVSSGDTRYYPVPQRYLRDDHDNNGPSRYYDKLAKNKQCIPPHHVSLVKTETRLMDEDAVILLMKECGYWPGDNQQHKI